MNKFLFGILSLVGCVLLFAVGGEGSRFGGLSVGATYAGGLFGHLDRLFEQMDSPESQTTMVAAVEDFLLESETSNKSFAPDGIMAVWDWVGSRYTILHPSGLDSILDVSIRESVLVGSSSGGIVQYPNPEDDFFVPLSYRSLLFN